jgi:hypothetical protein
MASGPTINASAALRRRVHTSFEISAKLCVLCVDRPSVIVVRPLFVS